MKKIESKEDIFKAITDVLVNDFECEQNKLEICLKI